MSARARRVSSRWPPAAWSAITRSLGLVILGFAAFAIVLLAFGRNPLRAYVDIFSSTLGSWYGFSETLVKMTPLVLAARGRRGAGAGSG